MPDEPQFTEPFDPFDPENLRITGDDFPTEKVVLVVPVRRPGKQEWFRVHPDDAYRLDAMVYTREDGMDREDYLLTPAVAAELLDVSQPVRVFTCMSRRKVVFLWPARLPAERGAGRDWHVSALKIADDATRQWVRMAANKDRGAYDMHKALGDPGGARLAGQAVQGPAQAGVQGQADRHAAPRGAARAARRAVGGSAVPGVVGGRLRVQGGHRRPPCTRLHGRQGTA
jgi:hypothetical protein